MIKYGAHAKINDNYIFLEGDISHFLLEDLLSKIQITTIQNYDTFSGDGISSPDKKIITETQDYDLRYPTVHQGEVFLCDFGTPYKSEQGFIRPAIVIQKDNYIQNPNALVIPVTTTIKRKYEFDWFGVLGQDTMVDYDTSFFSTKESVALTAMAKVVDKSRFRRYLGKLKKDVTDEIVEKVCKVIGLKMH